MLIDYVIFYSAKICISIRAYVQAKNYYGNVNLGNWIEISIESICLVDEKLFQAKSVPLRPKYVSGGNIFF